MPTPLDGIQGQGTFVRSNIYQWQVAFLEKQGRRIRGVKLVSSEKLESKVVVNAAEPGRQR